MRYPPPPTYANVVDVEPGTQKSRFNPIWLDWFLKLVQTAVANASTGATGAKGDKGDPGAAGASVQDSSQTLSFANPLLWNASGGHLAFVTLTGNTQLDIPSNLTKGTYILIVTQDAVGSRTMSYQSGYKFPGGSGFTLTTTANAIDIITFVSDGTSMFGVGQKKFS